MKHIFSLLFAGVLSVTAATGTYAQQQQQQQREFTPDRKLMVAQQLIENYYVDDVDADSIVTEAIIAMLKTLDPHSAYSTPKETEELNQPLEGKFSGIGVQFSIVRDTVQVVQTTQGGPSEKVGIRPGDRIIYVNDTLFTRPKMQNSDVLKTLRGPQGSVVNLKIKRAGTPELIDFRLVRDLIPIYSVSAAYMVTPTTGYVNISRFAEDTANEFDNAVKQLKAKGMRNIIIDLTGNGGGYLGSAYQMASRFLNPGDLVVYTKGKNMPAQYLRVEDDKSVNSGIDRVVVMVNQYSASASEILSGALQDHDRGVIVGRRTFGKGLVQRPFPFPDGSMIRLTTSRYYTPSGRSIQKHYEKGQGEEYQLDMLNRMQHGELFSADSIHFDESQKFRTLRNGRTVYGGGGIMPDSFVPVDTFNYTIYYRDLVAKGVINSYIIDYIDKHRQELLKQYPSEDAFSANFNPEQLLEGLVAAGEKDGIARNDEQLAVSGKVLMAMMKGLLERDLYENGSYMRAVNHLDPVFNEALRIIENPTEYNRLLGNKATNRH